MHIFISHGMPKHAQLISDNLSFATDEEKLELIEIRILL